MADPSAPTPASKPAQARKKTPPAPARPARSQPPAKGERPIADVDRKVRGGDA